MLAILGAVAAFEADLRKERQAEGIVKAKEAGVYKGRKPTVDVTRVRELRAEGKRPAEIVRELKISKASVFRALSPRS